MFGPERNADLQAPKCKGLTSVGTFLRRFQNKHNELDRALDLATDLLAGVCSKLIAEVPTLDKVGSLAAKLLNTPGGWSPKKEQMRQHLENLTRVHQYEGAWLDYRDYQLMRVGQSLHYNVPLGKRGLLR